MPGVQTIKPRFATAPITQPDRASDFGRRFTQSHTKSHRRPAVACLRVPTSSVQSRTMATNEEMQAEVLCKCVATDDPRLKEK
jgi:hypothetical protein